MQEEKLKYIIEVVDKATKEIDTITKKMSELENKAKEVGDKVSAGSMSFGKLTGAFTVATVAAQGLIGALSGVANTIVGAIKGMFSMGIASAGLKEAGFTAEVVGQRMGYMSEEIRKTIQTVELFNINSATATRFITEMARAQVDMAKSTDIARAAQNLGILTQSNSNEVIERITQAIQTMNPMILRQVGITKLSSQIFDEYGDKIGKSGDALTDLERRQAIANEVLREGSAVGDLYNISLASSQKSLDSLINRVESVKLALGEMFRPFLDVIIPKLNSIATSFTVWLQANEDTIRGVGTAISEFLLRPITQLIEYLEWLFAPLKEWHKLFQEGKATMEDQAGAIEKVNERMATLIPYINAAGNVMMFFVGVVKVLISIFMDIYNRIAYVVKIIGALIQIGSGLAQMLGSILPQANKNLTVSLGPVAGAFQKIGDVAQWVLGHLKNFASAIGGAIGKFLPEDVKEGLDKLKNAQIDYVNGQTRASDMAVSGFGDMVNALQGKAFDFEDIMKKIPQIPRDMAPDVEAAMQDLSDAVGKGGEKIAKEAEKIAKDLAKNLEDIASEIGRHADSVRAKTEDFQRSLEDLVIRHRDKIKELRKDLQELASDYAEAQQGRKEAHEDKRGDILERFEDETKNLKENLQRRLADTKGSDEQLIKFFEAQIAEKEAKRDEEIAKEDARFAEEEAKQKETYDKRKNQLQEALNVELEIQRKHQADFDAVKDKAAEDDITRLKTTFSREMEEMKKQHEIKMEELRKQQEEILKLKAETDAKMLQGYVNSAVNRSVQKSTGINYSAFQSQSQLAKNAGLNYTPAYFTPVKRHGGGIVPGNGDVPILAKGGEAVLTAQQMNGVLKLLEGQASGGKGVNINQTNHIYNQVDLDAKNRELGWKLNLR